MKKQLTNTVIFLIIALFLITFSVVAQVYFDLEINGNAGLFAFVGYILGVIASSFDYRESKR